MSLNKIETLANYLEIEVDAVRETNYDTYEAEGAEYLVYTDEESEDAWGESLDDYIEECVLIDIPKQYHNYFDTEGFKSDCRYDGRGHTLASYDGNEGEQDEYYIYRVG